MKYLRAFSRLSLYTFISLMACILFISKASAATYTVGPNSKGNMEWGITDEGVLEIWPKAGTDGHFVQSFAIGLTTSSWRSPWHTYRNQVTKVVVKDGVRSNSLSGMFYDMPNVKSIDLRGFSDNVFYGFTYTFANCTALEEVIIPKNFNISKANNMTYSFLNCSSLKELDLSAFQTTDNVSLDSIFRGCTSLEKLNIRNFDTTKVTNYNQMFTDCSSLKYVAVSSYDIYSRLPARTGGWYRFATIARRRLYDKLRPTNASSMKEAWYTYGDQEDNFDAFTDWYVSESELGSNDHSNIPWEIVDDDTWSYSFEVFDSSQKYYLFEMPLSGYQTDTSIDSYQIINGEDGENVESATIENSLEQEERFSLRIEKEVQQSSSTDYSNRSFAITVKLDYLEAVETKLLNSVVFTYGVGTIYLKPGESKRFTGIPKDSHYSVSESSYADFETNYELDGSILSSVENRTLQADTTVHVQNTELDLEVGDRASFTLAKNVRGNASDINDSFRFFLQLQDLEPETSYQLSDGTSFLSDQSGRATLTISLRDGMELSFMGLPAGATYSITEEETSYLASYEITEKDGKAVSDMIALGLLSSERGENTEVEESLSIGQCKLSTDYTPIITFTNTKDENTARFSFIKKAIDGTVQEGVRFRISGIDELGTNIERLAVSDENGLVDFGALAVGSYTLDEVVAIEGYARITGYQVHISRDGNGEIRLEFLRDDDTALTVDGSLGQYVLYNHPIETSLEIYKTVYGGGDREFQFQLKLSSGGQSITDPLTVEKHGSGGVQSLNLTESDGYYNFTLKHGEYILIENLPYQTSYEVRELEDAFYTSHITSGNGSSVLQSESPVRVRFLNSPKPNVELPETGSTELMHYLFLSIIAFLISLSWYIRHIRISQHTPTNEFGRFWGDNEASL